MSNLKKLNIVVLVFIVLFMAKTSFENRELRNDLESLKERHYELNMAFYKKSINSWLYDYFAPLDFVDVAGLKSIKHMMGDSNAYSQDVQSFHSLGTILTSRKLTEKEIKEIKKDLENIIHPIWYFGTNVKKINTEEFHSSGNYTSVYWKVKSSVKIEKRNSESNLITIEFKGEFN
ncbi:MAG: hypothetical protein COA79_21045 [Planctomycetota bacterium]|nr:MAG: hypothetical protein COA79_21045 [Planctomycetota bacterium]